MSEGNVLIVSPEDGDGESFYYEVTLNGETWDGRTSSRELAEEEAAELLARLAELQRRTGRNHEGVLP